MALQLGSEIQESVLRETIRPCPFVRTTGKMGAESASNWSLISLKLESRLVVDLFVMVRT